ncbi:MAG: hypothetical protein ACTS8P_01860, partial [Arsenophonus sp. NC-XBC3-MAG3]
MWLTEGCRILFNWYRKSYQIDQINHNEAIRESLIDKQECADVLMIK